MRKKIQNVYKKLIYLIFIALNGKIKGILKLKDNKDVTKVSFKDNINYRIYFCKNSRIYTDTIHDTAIIQNNLLIEGASFQFRNNVMSKVDENIVFKKGTPRLKKKIKGKVFSLLTGGGGNENYFHWLFDVLPRLRILQKRVDVADIDYFLFPDTKLKFQRESLDIFQIPVSKRLSSRDNRHIYADEIITVDHPCVILNDPNRDNENLPNWIINFYRDSFVSNINDKKKTKKFFIDRDDSRSNIRHLRSILNEKEVKNFLSSRGFQIIQLSSLTFLDQINLFSEAEIVIGLHGAGLSNLLFCQPKTKVIEIKLSHIGNMYKNLGRQVNLNYINFIGKGEETNHKLSNQLGNVFVDLNELEKCINSL